MLHYIYKQIVLPISINSQQDSTANTSLDDLGKIGWELVCCHPVMQLASDKENTQRFLMIFKRAITS
jgi:hypothetical protein